MSRRKTVEYLTRCCLCGSEIKHRPDLGKSYCISCKNQIMSEWSKVPFEVRVKLLSRMREAQGNVNIN